MTDLDYAILLFILVLAGFGLRRGFVVGVLALVGFAAGAWLGTRLAGAVITAGSASPYAPLFGLLGALLGGVVLGTGLEGVGVRIRRVLRIVPGFGVLDGLLGAALSAALGLGVCWLLGAVLLQTPGAADWRADVQRSSVLSRLNDVLPPSGGLLNALARFDPFPTIDGPAARVGPPPAQIGSDPQVAAAAASVVRVTGTACGLGVEGSGWVAPGGLVVTNAHVVAGQTDTGVQIRGQGARLPARAVAFDAVNDLAVLRVEGLGDVPALPLAGGASTGQPGAVLGFPRNGPYDVRGARIGQTREVRTEDAYGRDEVRRRVTSFRATVRPGNSGGPVVDTAGRVLAVVFATARGASGGGTRTGYGVPLAEVRAALAAAGDPVGTGPCAPD